jgi:transcription antitermination factor NusG
MEHEKKWYVLRAIGGKEKKAQEYIEMKYPALTFRIILHRFLYLPKRYIKFVMARK